MIWIIVHIPALIMSIMLIYDYKQWKLLTFYSGYCALVFFVITLSLTPLKTIFPKWVILTKLNRYRRQLGVASFTHTLIHLSCFLIKRIIKGFSEGLVYFFHPAIIPAFWIAFPILLILALTSNQYSIRKISFLRWKKLHKTVYIAEIAIMLHMTLTGDFLMMLMFFVPLCGIQLLKYKKEKSLPPQ